MQPLFVATVEDKGIKANLLKNLLIVRCDMARPLDIERGSFPLGPGRTTLVDPGVGPIKTKHGFAAVAENTVFDLDRNTTIFRRYDKLSARNLLFYQAELAELEELQDKYDEEDLISKECQRDWRELSK
jgi:hypothetical protein